MAHPGFHSFVSVIMISITINGIKCCSISCPDGTIPCGGYDSLCNGFIGCMASEECQAITDPQSNTGMALRKIGETCGPAPWNGPYQGKCGKGLYCDHTPLSRDGAAICRSKGCPNTCKCEAGATWDGGKELNNQGYCEYHCSKWGYCGNGTKYSDGTDCTGCKNQGCVKQGEYCSQDSDCCDFSAWCDEKCLDNQCKATSCGQGNRG